MVEADVFGRHRDDFVVRFAAINHLHEADRSHRDEDAGGNRVGREHDDVERIAVFPKRLRREAVVARIRGSGEIDTVELDEARLFVDLVLVVRAFRYLNDDVEFLRGVLAEGGIVPQIHKNSF